MRREHAIEGADGPAVRVRDEDVLVPARERLELPRDGPGDLLRRRMKRGRQAAHLDVLPARAADDREHLAGEGSAGEDEDVAARHGYSGNAS